MLDIIVKIDEFELDRGYVQDVTFTDNLTGALDEITVGICDPDHKWLGSWVPHKNDRITFMASLGSVVLDLPDFFLESWDLSAWPGGVNLKALSQSIAGANLRKKRTANHYDVTLRGLVSGLAQRNGLKLLWEGDDTGIVKRLCQKNMSDLAYLEQTARQTGRVCKVQNGFLIFIPLSFGGTRLERFGDTARLVPGAGKRNIVIKPEHMTAPPKITHSGITPGKKEFRRYQPLQARLDKVRGESGDVAYDGGVNTSVNLGWGSELAAWSSALEANLAGVTVAFALLPRIDIAAGSLVYVTDIGTYSGTYLVQKLSHKIGASGWTVEVETGRISAGQLAPPTKAQAVNDKNKNTAALAAEVDAKNAARLKGLDSLMDRDIMQGDTPEWYTDEERAEWLTEEG